MTVVSITVDFILIGILILIFFIIPSLVLILVLKFFKKKKKRKNKKINLFKKIDGTKIFKKTLIMMFLLLIAIIYYDEFTTGYGNIFNLFSRLFLPVITLIVIILAYYMHKRYRSGKTFLGYHPEKVFKKYPKDFFQVTILEAILMVTIVLLLFLSIISIIFHIGSLASIFVMLVPILIVIFVVSSLLKWII